MKNYNVLIICIALLGLQSCFVKEGNQNITDADSTQQVVNVYSHRHYDVDKQIYTDFEKETGIKVKVIEDDADKLMVRIQNEGENSPADLLITADAGRLIKAKKEGLLQSVQSDVLNESVPAHLRDSEGFWIGLTMRARVIVFQKERVKAGDINDYEDLALPKWKGRLLIRSSENVYNQSLVAALIAHIGKEKTLEWAKGVVSNMAREPKGGDKDQVLAIAAGEGDLAVVNTYYIGKMLQSDNPEEVKAAEQISILFPNQNNRGTHINISGAGVIKTAPNKANAIKLLEYMTSEKVQKLFAEANNEYPVRKNTESSALLKGWGEFKQDSLALDNLGKYNEEALIIFNESGWK